MHLHLFLFLLVLSFSLCLTSHSALFEIRREREKAQSQLKSFVRLVMSRQPSTRHPSTVRLLICDSGLRMVDWYRLFRGRKLADGSTVEVEVRPMNKISVCSYAESGPLVELAPFYHQPYALPCQNLRKTFTPDFILNRSMIVTPTESYIPQLMGFVCAQLPAVNSFKNDML